MTRKMDTLATPHDSLVTTTLNLIGDSDEWTRFATVPGVCTEHHLYASADGESYLYIVDVTSGSMSGIRASYDEVRDFAIYTAPKGDPFPLVHLLTEAAHDEYLAEVG